MATRFQRLAGAFEEFCVEFLSSNGLHGVGKVREFRWPRAEGFFAGAWMHYEVKLDGIHELIPDALLMTEWPVPTEHEGQPTIFAFELHRMPTRGEPINIGFRTASNALDAEAAKVQTAEILHNWNEGISVGGSNASDGQGWSGAWIESRVGDRASAGAPVGRKERRARRSKSTRRGTSKPKRGTRSSRAPSSSRDKKRKRTRGGKKRRS